jgi:hypothetical protein
MVGGLVLTLAFAAAALGATKHYKGPVTQGGQVKFTLQSKHGKRKVKNFLFSGVTLTCEGRDPFAITNNGFPVPAMRVRHRHFHGAFSQLGGTGDIKGDFNHHYRKATGTLRVHAQHIQGTPLHNCDTGTVNWTAEKQ